MSLEDKILGILATTLTLALVVCIGYLGVTAVGHKACLEAGYAQTEVTWDLDVYCLTLDGDVTVKIEEIE